MVSQRKVKNIQNLLIRVLKVVSIIIPLLFQVTNIINNGNKFRLFPSILGLFQRSVSHPGSSHSHTTSLLPNTKTVEELAHKWCNRCSRGVPCCSCCVRMLRLAATTPGEMEFTDFCATVYWDLLITILHSKTRRIDLSL